MARLPRLVVPGYPDHLTLRAVRSMAVFTSDDDRDAYLSFVAEECKHQGSGQVSIKCAGSEPSACRCSLCGVKPEKAVETQRAQR